MFQFVVKTKGVVVGKSRINESELEKY
jgi:hypothetical protein